MDPANPTDKNVRRATELQRRKDLIEGLRHFTVRVPARDANGQPITVEERVMAHRHMFGPMGILLFVTDTVDGSFVRRVFRFWKDVEEVVVPDGGKSASGRSN